MVLCVPKPKNRASLPGGLLSINFTVTCTGKGVNILSASHWNRIKSYDDNID